MMTPRASLWIAVALATALDGLILSEFATFARHLNAGGMCGTWAVQTQVRMMLFGLIALPVGLRARWSYRTAAWTMGRPARTLG